MSLAASEGRLEPSEADASTEQASTGAEFQSEANAEKVAVLAWADKSIGLEWSRSATCGSTWLRCGNLLS